MPGVKGVRPAVSPEKLELGVTIGLKEPIAWDEHVHRSRSGCKWNLSLLSFHDTSWLQQQKFVFAAVAQTRSNPWTMFAGRMGTRAAAGKVQPRWQEAVHKVRNRSL